MRLLSRVAATAAAVVLSFSIAAQETLPADTRAAIDKAVADALAKSGAPSASLAVVKDGKLAFARAYGLARVQPPLPATPGMRYSIGSVSKQFTAAAILLLAEEGKLSLDDKVTRWLPELTRSNEVTIRHLLSMTSGYPDFWPQDYVMPGMLEDATPQQIISEWARQPLSFDPGSKNQYSNTNYVIAGLIIEKVAGVPVFEFLQRRIFTPLDMKSVTDTDAAALPETDPMRYTRYGLAPVRPAPKEGRGWMFAAGELAMTASDLAKWNIAMINGSAMQPRSYAEMFRDTLLSSGAGTRYGLGVGIAIVDGRRVISHGGEVSGFTSNNSVYPDHGVAITVLTNLDATGASGDIASRVAKLVFATSDPATATSTERARHVFEALQKGRIDRSLFTSNANAYFSDVALRDFASSLGPLGKPQEFTQTRQSLRGGMTARSYGAKFPKQTLRITTFETADGKLEQYIVAVGE